MSRLFCMSFLLAASVFDISKRKIPNQLIVMGWLFSLFIRGVDQGRLGIKNAFLAGIFVILICWPVFLLRGVGAGDIKIWSVIGSLYGIRKLFFIVVVLGILAGMYSIAIMFYQGIFRERFRYTLYFLTSGRGMGERYYDKERDGTEMTIILAPFTLIAYVLVLIGRWGSM